MNAVTLHFRVSPLPRTRGLAIAAIVVAIGLTNSLWLHAAEVVCSVCGKSFSIDTEICPNDGTDLKKLGIKINVKPESEAQDHGKQATEEVNKKVSPSTEEDDEEAKPIYKRGGRRRVIKPSSSSYSDRLSRIGDRRGRNTGQEEVEGEDEKRLRFMEEDKKLLAQYETQRRQASALRQRMDFLEKKSNKDRKAARRRLLYGLGAPLTSLGFRMFWMGEGNDPGAVNAIEIDLNLARYRFRVGLSTLIGVRSLPGRNELVFLEHVALGFQWPWRYSPFIVVRGGVGVSANERFGVSFVNLLTSVGVDIGVDSWITPWIAITPTVGYTRTMLDNAYWNSFTFKIAMGF